MTSLELDKIVETLASNKDELARLPIGRKIQYLEQLRTKTDEVAERWMNAAVKAKRIPVDSPLVGEQWMSGPWALLKGVRVLIEAELIDAQGDAQLSRARMTLCGGRLV